jgi:magnesium transporter
MKTSTVSPGKVSKGFDGTLLNEKGSHLHPYEIAQIINKLPGTSAVKAFSSFMSPLQLQVFPNLDPLVQKNLVIHLPKERSAFLINSLRLDDIVSFYSTIRRSELAEYYPLLNEKNKKATFDILGYPSDSVARLLNTDYATLKRKMTIQEAQDFLRTHQSDTNAANDIFVVDEHGKLLDDIPIRRLVLNDPLKKIEDIMDGFCARLNISDTKDSAIEKFKMFDRVTLPVVDKDNLLMGVVTIDDVLTEEERRNTREMQKFGGVESLDYPYVKTPFFSLVRKRAGWLIILFLSEMLTATAMGYFDTEISKAVVLALFVPLIISSGGNSGSQAATLIIRALAVKELNLKDWWYVMRREILSGLTLGLVLGSIGFIRIALWQYFHWFDYGSHWALIASTIFFSLIGIVMWGTLSGSMIPIVLKLCRLDPATSSAPFVATLVDVTGLVIYFSIAAILLKGTLL